MGAAPAAANQNRLYFECPCEFVREGDTFTVTVGIRNFRTDDSGPLSLSVFAASKTTGVTRFLGRVAFAESVAAGAVLEPASYEIAIAARTIPAGQNAIRLQIGEEVDGQIYGQGQLHMELPVDLNGPFRVGDRDYLKDSDGDGAGDINERLEATDPADPDSAPDDPVIDVLILYSQSVPALYDGDPVTRIQHEFTLANQMLADSDVAFRFRPVGAVQVEIDESTSNTHDYLDVQTQEAERHGADLVVWYRPRNLVNYRVCGHARAIGGLFDRGHFEFEDESANYAMVHADCDATTLAHELGHVMGLDHAYWQDSVGTWRWSRGHAVDGADAVATLNAASFQIAAFRDSLPDADGDGFVDPVDDLPADPADWVDTDNDGTGNRQDTDDDGDGVSDGDDVFPLDGSETLDTDADGVNDDIDAFPLDAAKTDIASYLLIGAAAGDEAGRVLASSRDDGPGRIAIGVPQHDADGKENAGAVYAIAASDLESLDAADGATDGAINLGNASGQTGSWKLVGEAPGDNAAHRVASVGDLDGDGYADIVLSASLARVDGGRTRGAAYVISVADFAAADAGDGLSDHVIDLGHVAAQPGSWKLFNGAYADWIYRLVSSAEKPDSPSRWLLVGNHLMSWEDLAGADAKDGVLDGSVDLLRLILAPDSWYLDVALNSAFVGDVDGKGHSHVFAMVLKEPPRSGFLFSTADLAGAGVPDEAADGHIDGEEIERFESSRHVSGIFAAGIAAAGKVDSDDLADMLLAEANHPSDTDRRGRIYLLFGADVAALDRVDGRPDRGLHLGNVAGDTDNDGVGNTIDRDDDGDGVPDSDDELPLNAAESLDTDRDGIGNNADTEDLFPLDRTRSDLTSYRIDMETDVWVQDHGPGAATAGDLDGDGKQEMLIGVSDAPMAPMALSMATSP